MTASRASGDGRRPIDGASGIHNCGARGYHACDSIMGSGDPCCFQTTN